MDAVFQEEAGALNNNNVDAAVNLLVYGCDMCATITTFSDAVGTKCGHYFCYSCLIVAYQAQEHSDARRPCPVWDKDIREEMSQSMFTDTPPSHEAFMARIDVGENYLKREKERLNAVRLENYRRLSEVRGARITELEQCMQNLMQMNWELLDVETHPRPSSVFGLRYRGVKLFCLPSIY